MEYLKAFNLSKWIDEHRDKLKPPVGNLQVFEDAEFIVMIVGGPNSRTDFHVNEGEEFFHQLEGDITLRVIEGGKIRDIPIREGDILLLPPKVPHSPQRPANTVGMVVERKRKDDELDYLQWYCDSCNQLLYRDSFQLKNIVTQLKAIINTFYEDESLRTCKHCGAVSKVPS